MHRHPRPTVRPEVSTRRLGAHDTGVPAMPLPRPLRRLVVQSGLLAASIAGLALGASGGP